MAVFIGPKFRETGACLRADAQAAMTFPAGRWSAMQSLDLWGSKSLRPETVEAVCQNLTLLTCLELGCFAPAVTDRYTAAPLLARKHAGMLFRGCS